MPGFPGGKNVSYAVLGCSEYIFWEGNEYLLLGKLFLMEFYVCSAVFGVSKYFLRKLKVGQFFLVVICKLCTNLSISWYSFSWRMVLCKF